MELLEREDDRSALTAAIDEAAAAGRGVVVAGEAGIGKTSLVSSVCGELDGRRVLWSACDPLITPRPMGPLRDAADLHAISGGNPFFVTEVLAAPGAGVPATVRESVALRVAGLDAAAQAVVEVAAVVPGPTELALLDATVGPSAAAIDACIAAGLLRLQGAALAFRHDLARRALEDAIAPARRRELDRLVLAALEAGGGADPARLAHHARRTGDAEAIRRVVPAAARAASAARGHRQAYEHWEAALAAGAGAEALEGVALEGYLSGLPERAMEGRRALLEIHEAAGDALRTGDDLRWVARHLWWTGRSAEAMEEALSDAGEDAPRLEALATFDRLGASRTAAHVRRRLRAAGVRRIPRGPRPASRAAPGGLTAREVQVLELIVDRATNAQIARALVISPKTVDHHVSAVLAKLGVTSRRLSVA